MSCTANPTGPLAWLGVVVIELEQVTAIEATAVAGSPVRSAVAVLATMAHTPGAVGLVTWTVWLSMAARVKVPVSGQFSVWVAGAPVIVHVAGPCWSAMPQSSPGPPGSESVMVKPLAGNGPGLVSVMVKPIGEPAVTTSASAVLVRSVTTTPTCSVVSPQFAADGGCSGSPL